MADLFFNSAGTIARSLSFPSLFFLPSKSFPFTCLPIRRRSSPFSFKILCTPPSHDSVSKEEYHLISTAECSDGSIVFRFGHAAELRTEIGDGSSEVPSEEAAKSDTPARIRNENAARRKKRGRFGETINYKVLTPVGASELNHVIEQEEAAEKQTDGGNDKSQSDSALSSSEIAVVKSFATEEGGDEKAGVEAVITSAAGEAKHLVDASNECTEANLVTSDDGDEESNSQLDSAMSNSETVKSFATEEGSKMNASIEAVVLSAANEAKHLVDGSNKCTEANLVTTNDGYEESTFMQGEVKTELILHKEETNSTKVDVPVETDASPMLETVDGNDERQSDSSVSSSEIEVIMSSATEEGSEEKASVEAVIASVVGEAKHLIDGSNESAEANLVTSNDGDEENNVVQGEVETELILYNEETNYSNMPVETEERPALEPVDGNDKRQSDSSVSSSEIEVIMSSATEEGIEEKASVEAVIASVVGEAKHLIDGSNEPAEANLVTNNDGDEENNVVQGEVETEPILHNEETNSSNMPVETEESPALEPVDGNLQLAKLKKEKVEGLAQRYYADMSIFAVEPQTINAPMEREQIYLTELFLSSGAASLQNPSQALTGGEDAYFIDQNWLGIADGAGLWSLEGTNTGLYAGELIKNCQKLLSDNRITLTEPAEVLCKAAAETHSPGLSTALVAHFDGQALCVATIGDSGFIIVRNSTIFKRSSPMMHELNFPLQIKSGDDPSKLIEGYKIDLNEGDVIITATDGFFDNIYEQEMVQIVSKSVQSGLKPQDIAEVLATRALEVGKTAYARSPFADAAQAAGYVGYTGGRLDDVTVIVSLVMNGSASQS